MDRWIQKTVLKGISDAGRLYYTRIYFYPTNAKEKVNIYIYNFKEFHGPFKSIITFLKIIIYSSSISQMLSVTILSRGIYSMIHLFLLNFIYQLHCAQSKKNIARSYYVIRFIVPSLLRCSVFFQIDASEKDR